MDRVAAGIMIAIAALVMNGGLVRDALARETGPGAETQAAAAANVMSQTPVAHGLRSERVLSLVLTLEALRAAPGLLDRSKV
jgi:Na+/alanine symporter